MTPVQRLIYEYGRREMIDDLRALLDADPASPEKGSDIPDDIDDNLLWTKWMRA